MTQTREYWTEALKHYEKSLINETSEDVIFSCKLQIIECKEQINQFDKDKANELKLLNEKIEWYKEWKKREIDCIEAYECSNKIKHYQLLKREVVATVINERPEEYIRTFVEIEKDPEIKGYYRLKESPEHKIVFKGKGKIAFRRSRCIFNCYITDIKLIKLHLYGIKIVTDRIRVSF